MKLKFFTVEHFRSITNTKKIKLDNLTVLVGPNNEGKSNLLRALVLAMNVLTRGEHVNSPSYRRRYGNRGIEYDWEFDYPLQLQEKNPTGVSVVIVEFELLDEELTQFEREVGSKISGTLPLRIALGRNEHKVTFHKKGLYSAQLSAKKTKIANFVAKHLDFSYISAIRTADSAEEVVNELVERELSQLENNPEYRKLLGDLAKMQAPILKGLSGSILKTFQQFLPKVKAVDVRIRSEDRFRALRRSAEIQVNDGTPTLLSYKGDGAQSLAALALIRHSSERKQQGKNLIIAIEEPESHLHPEAIHELKSVITDLSKKHQIIITTHNPLFVDRATVSNNIIVKSAKAKAACSLEDLRETLGVRAADNLRHAEMVLVVEGETDITAVRALLEIHSPFMAKALKNGFLALDSLQGAGKLSYKVSQLRTSLCRYHAFLDHDDAGRRAAQEAIAKGLISSREINYATVSNLADSEIEDLFDVSLYANVVSKTFGVDLSRGNFNQRKKWSGKMRDLFFRQGKTWNDQIESHLKTLVSQAVATNPAIAVKDYHKETIGAFGRLLEERLRSTME